MGLRLFGRLGCVQSTNTALYLAGALIVRIMKNGRSGWTIAKKPLILVKKIKHSNRKFYAFSELNKFKSNSKVDRK